MSDRSLKKSLSDKSNRAVDYVVEDADENLDVFSVNRDVLLKPGRHSFEQTKLAKPEADDYDKKHENDPLYTVFEVPLGTLSRLVLEARNSTPKLQSLSSTTSASKNETDPTSKPTRSNSTIRPSNIPTLRPSNIPTLRPTNIPTLRPTNINAPTARSSSVPKKTTTTSASASASASSPKRTGSRSLTPVSLIRKTPSTSPTPSKITTSTTPSFKKTGDAQRSRSLTPRSKPQVTENSASPSSKTKVRSASVTSRPSFSATPRTPPRLKETVTLAFGRPVGSTIGNVNSPKRNTSPDVMRTRPKVHSAPSLIPTFSVTPKSVKPSVTLADSPRSGRKLSKASIQLANNHLEAKKGKVGTNPLTSTMLYPHSIRSSSIRKRCGSSEGSSSSNQEEEEGKSLTKEENTEKNDSARYDALLNVKDMKDTHWLLNFDGDINQSLIFDNVFDSPPDLFPPL